MWFVYTYGIKAAKKMLGGNLFSYTPDGYKQMGAKKKTPKAGDVVFFYNNSMKRIAHVGLVTEVTSTRFYTVEGNTSSDPGVVRNGGSVNQKNYALNYSLAYFATPQYGVVTKGTDTVATSTTKASTKTAADNGNPYTAPASTGVTLKKGSKGESVKWVQYELNQWKSSLSVDGEFGTNTETQVKAYQKAYGLTVDGQVGPKTIAMLKKDGK
jgi:hypothetical protein